MTKTNIIKINTATARKNDGFDPGEIVYSSWGYNMTHIYWYLVLDRHMTKGGQEKVTLVQLAGNEVGGQFGTTTPNRSSVIGTPFSKVLKTLDSGTKAASISSSRHEVAFAWGGTALTFNYMD